MESEGCTFGGSASRGACRYFRSQISCRKAPDWNIQTLDPREQLEASSGLLLWLLRSGRLLLGDQIMTMF